MATHKRGHLKPSICISLAICTPSPQRTIRWQPWWITTYTTGMHSIWTSMPSHGVMSSTSTIEHCAILSSASVLAKMASRSRVGSISRPPVK